MKNKRYSLFSEIQRGLQPNGSCIDVFGWESYALNDAFGIEPFVAIDGFETPEAFMTYLQSATGCELQDWEPISITLYLCWIPPFEERYPNHFPASLEPQLCYSVWRSKPDGEAVNIKPVKVYALRHRAWSFIEKGDTDAFHCARQRSYTETAWLKRNPGQRLTPQIMSDSSCTGFRVMGKKSHMGKSKFLTWPSMDLAETFRNAEEFIEKGFQELEIVSEGIAISFDEYSREKRQLLLRINQQLGGVGSLSLILEY